MAVLAASLMRDHNRQNFNNNPHISTPMTNPYTGTPKPNDVTRSRSAPPTMTIDDRLSTARAPQRKMPRIEYGSDDDAIAHHTSPTSITECMDVDSRASPVVEPQGPPPQDQAVDCSDGEAAPLGCFSKPGRAQNAVRLLGEASNLMRDVYVYLVRHRIFACSDILESPEPLDRAELDPMGVLFSAQTIARNVLTDELLHEHALDVQIREVLATILLMVYKLRSESNYHSRYGAHSITSIVMSQFMVPAELPIRNYDAVRDHMMHIEMELILKTPIFRLVDETPHAACEWCIYRHYRLQVTEFEERHAAELDAGDVQARCELRDMVATCHSESLLALSGAYFFYHAALIADNDMLEEMGQWATSETMGEAIAHLCLKAIHLLKQPGLCRPLPAVGKQVERAAGAFLMNALRMSTRNAKGLRADALGNGLHPCQQIVGSKALSRLMSLYKPYNTER